MKQTLLQIPWRTQQASFLWLEPSSQPTLSQTACDAPQHQGPTQHAGICSRALIGFRLPYIPDVLRADSTRGEDDANRIEWILRQQMETLAALWVWPAGFAIRYLWNPSTQEIEAAFLARIDCTRNDSPMVGDFARSVSSSLEHLGFAPQPFCDTHEFEKFSMFPQWGTAVIEVLGHRQPIALTGGGELRVVPGLQASNGDGTRPIETLSSWNRPLLVSLQCEAVKLEPAALAEMQRQAFRAKGILSETEKPPSDAMKQEFYRGQPIRRGTIIEFHEKADRLHRPFRSRLVVVGADGESGLTVASAFAAAVSPHLASQENLRVTLLSSCAAERRACARALWTEIQTTREDADGAGLRCLDDSEGTAAWMRFPIPHDGGLRALRVQAVPPGHSPGPDLSRPGADRFLLGHAENGTPLYVPRRELTHTFISGMTRSGKTKTAYQILTNLWTQRRSSFLFLEASKKEARGLLRLEVFRNNLRVYSAGDEATSPLRLNAFDILPGVRVHVHIGRLSEALLATMPQFGALTSIMKESVEEVYRDHGWALTDVGLPPESMGARRIPTFEKLLKKVQAVIRARKYSDKMESDLLAATETRLKPLFSGTLGMMFRTEERMNVEELLSHPTVVELNDLPIPDKNLVVLLLLMFLREHRELHPIESGGHITVLEEAHNVLEDGVDHGPSEIASNVRGAALSEICAAICELGASGEVVMVLDQSAKKIHKDVLRNSRLKIAHCLEEAQDRDAVAESMNMSDSQRSFLTQLAPGQALVFFSGLPRPAVIRVPSFEVQYPEFGIAKDEEVRSHMEQLGPIARYTDLPFGSDCGLCQARCTKREAASRATATGAIRADIDGAVDEMGKQLTQTGVAKYWDRILIGLRQAASAAGDASLDFAWCALCHGGRAARGAPWGAEYRASLQGFWTRTHTS